MSNNGIAIHWFRKGLRLHDNPALVEACRRCKTVYPVFCIDPYFAKPHIVGVNRYSFLLQSLEDLHKSLQKLGSRLYILQGRPDEQLLKAIDRWNVNLLSFEVDTEPCAKQRDTQVRQLMRSKGIEVFTSHSHTLHPLEDYLARSNGSPPHTYQAFLKLFMSMKANLREESPTPLSIPHDDAQDLTNVEYNVPTLASVGYTEQPTTCFVGGETEALVRLQAKVVSCPEYVRTFSKPDTSPNSLEPSTTVLSPYLKFGCLSVRKFYKVLDDLQQVATQQRLTCTVPPVSLHGQLLWREFFYLQAYHNAQFDRMIGNTDCRQIPWQSNPTYLQAWKEGHTGYPFIDAIMIQLVREGWIHHLARHMVACFLTRGDLWQSWEAGVKVFDLYLLDDDYALNNANWQWLSCSNFFYQYFRCYSPIAFGKKTDPNGLYIKKYIPQLANYPTKFIYEPWKAPLSVQQTAGCVIGQDYPFPIVDHDIASKQNMQRMREAYAKQDELRALFLTQPPIPPMPPPPEVITNNNTMASASNNEVEVDSTDNKNKKKRLITDYLKDSDSNVNSNTNYKQKKTEK